MSSPKQNAPQGDAEDGKGADDDLESLRRALEDEQQRALRLLADFDNFRRRMAREQESARMRGRRDALLLLLPVLDTLERALGAGSSDPVFYNGVVATQRQFVTALREAGAEPIPTVGHAFDPKVHEAVATVPSDGDPAGTVTREVRRGWRFGEELLRAALVVVAVEAEDHGEWR
jgi:molecular chaperone GrpE